MKNGPNESEAKIMTAVLDASMPEDWRVRALYDCTRSGGHDSRAYLVLERFSGDYWSICRVLADSGWRFPDRESAFGGLLSDWSGRTSWTETIRFWKDPAVTFPCPPAASAEELCMKLSLLEGS